MNRLIRAALLCLPLASLAGCTGSKDIGTACKMTKPCSTATGEPCAMVPGDVSNSKVDYIALGSAECDDLTCVRTANTPGNPENQADIAMGYCTAPCIDDKDCEPDYAGKKGAMKCERLLLDQALLDALRRESPEEYEKIFGTGAASRYCVKPRAEQ